MDRRASCRPRRWTIDVFATLRPGANTTVDELMSYVANRVDEAPAKPKWITLIAKMPMTNVGKIYKPELRMMAAQAVVTARVNEVWAESKEAAPCPRVRIDAQKGIEVLLDEPALGDRAAQVRERLRQVLAPLPIKTTVTFDVPAERNAS
ncbi:acyl-CoA synthetase [Caballeronia choica]|uniref:Acyl-CoA synthetase n=1 Tax=Caballeronia choica TaxID=326476 RepID=A0A158KU96_9BURK|nr:acyl-CoA synthetase [Caballeronia choica]